MARHSFGILLFLLLSFTATADTALWEKLQSSHNMVVLMRNAESSGNRDGANMLTWDDSGNCRGESLLTEAGKAHAKRIGEVFAQHMINPTVITSPMCRCRDTAQIAFGDYLTDAELRQKPGSDEDSEEVFLETVADLLNQHRGQKPIVFVNHRPNINALTMELIAIGDLLVGHVTESGEIELLGRIRVEP